MTIEEILDAIREKMKNEISELEVKSEKRVVVSITPEAIVKVADYLFTTMGFRFIIASALKTKKGFEIYYHFGKDSNGLILSVHVMLPEEGPEIESLCGLFVAANWIEREMHELFGINFRNHPNQEKLISEGNWAEGVYPYRE